MRIHDVTWCPGEVQIQIPVSKTDQGGQGHVVVLPRADLEPVLCAPCALHRWITLRCAIWAAGHIPPGADDTQLAASTMERHRGARETTAAMSVVLAYQPVIDETEHVCVTSPGAGPASAEAIPLEARLRGHGPDRLFTAVHRTGRLAERMSSEVVSDILTRARTAAGLPTQGYSSHSLRAGFVTTADKGGADIMAIQQQTAHRTHESVAVYRRRNNPSDGNAVHALGL